MAEDMRTLVPLYTWAGDSATYAARLAKLDSDDVAVVTSTNNGPLPTNTDLMQHIAEAQAKGVTVLGYVPVNYGKRSFGDVLDDVIAWHRVYGVTRIFADEWPANWSLHHLGSLWGAIRAYVKPTPADPMILCVNPGVRHVLPNQPPYGCFVVEHEGAQPPSFVPSPWSVALVHSLPLDAVSGVKELLTLRNWKYGYVTSDGADGNPWDGA